MVIGRSTPPVELNYSYPFLRRVTQQPPRASNIGFAATTTGSTTVPPTTTDGGGQIQGCPAGQMRDPVTHQCTTAVQTTPTTPATATDINIHLDVNVQDFVKHRNEYQDDDDPDRDYHPDKDYYFDPDDRRYFWLDVRHHKRYFVFFVPGRYVTIPSVTNVYNTYITNPQSPATTPTPVSSVGDLFHGGNLTLMALAMGFIIVLVALSGSRR